MAATLNMRRIALLGRDGMLGSTFARLWQDRTSLALIRGERSRSTQLLLEGLAELQPNIIVNCIAHTDVEGAEDAEALSYAVNTDLPAALAEHCARTGALLVHFSSTGCYGGTTTARHSEYSPLLARSVHHKSKIAGERAVVLSGCRHLIFRLGWLYGGATAQRKNFIRARIREGRVAAEEGRVVRSNAFQFGSPTLVDDVVRQVEYALEEGLTGAFNCVADGAVSRYAYVSAILLTAGICCAIEPGVFPRRAPVADNESAVNLKLLSLGADRMPDWLTPLQRHVAELVDKT